MFTTVYRPTSAPGLFYCETAVVMAAACGLAFAEIC